MGPASQIAHSSNIVGEEKEKEKEGEAEVVSAVAGNGAAPAATPMQGPIPDSTEISISFEGHNSSIFTVRNKVSSDIQKIYKTVSFGSASSRARGAAPRSPRPSNSTWPRRSPGSR